MKTFLKKGTCTRDSRIQPNNIGKRKLCLVWMRAAQGCSICGKEHRSIEKYSRDEVKKSMNHAKQKFLSVLQTV